MWRKVLVACIALVGTFSVVYASNLDLQATTTTYHAAGALTGRINQKPANLTRSNSNSINGLGMQKGDKFLLGAMNPKNNTEPLDWTLINKNDIQNYYDKSTSEYLKDSAGNKLVNQNYGQWLALSNTEIANELQSDRTKWSIKVTTDANSSDQTTMADPDSGEMAVQMTLGKYSVNLSIQDKKVIGRWDEARLKWYVNDVKTNNTAKITCTVPTDTSTCVNSSDARTRQLQLANLYRVSTADSEQYTGEYPFILSMYDVFEEQWKTVPDTFNHIETVAPAFNVETKDLTFSADWHLMDTWDNGTNFTNVAFYVGADGTFHRMETDSVYNKRLNRPAMIADMDEVVFSVSLGSQDGNLGSVSEFALPSNYTSLYAAVNTGNNNAMKLRIYDSSYTAVLSSLKDASGTNDLQKSNNYYQITKGGSFQIQADAPASDNSTVSALLFNEFGIFQYYIPLETAKGQGLYTFDTSTIDVPVGKYQIAIVNEDYNEATTSPANCSKISDVMNLQIVEPLTIKYTNSVGSPTYGGSSIQAGMPIGYITPSNGVSPYTYQIISDSSDSTHANDYTYFKLASSANANGTWNVLIDGDKAPKGLPAGTYKFLITGVDANGYSEDNNGSPTAKANGTITVKKATPTISFTNTVLTNVPYSSGSTFTETITHTNTDSGVVPAYATNTSIASVSADADGNPFFTLNTVGATGDVIVTASLPASANFNSASTKKTIRVYKGMSNFKFTPSKNPITTTDTQNSNYLIGQLSLDDGSPNYNYAIDVDPNGDSSANANATSFNVSTSATSSKTMSVYTTGQLTAGTYYVTFKVKDGNQQTLYLPVVITVQFADQTGFEFYDYESNANITNDIKQIEYGTSNAKVVASGGLGTGAISYKIKDGEPNDVFTLDTSTGAISDIQKKGSVVVQATKAKDSNYNSKTIEMTVEIIDGKQEIKFNSTIPSTKKFVLDSTLAIPATLTRADKTNGDITYATSTSDICTIEDPSVAMLTMKKEGDCIVTASNSDENYETVTDTKTIKLYTGITGTLVQSIDPLHQGDAQAMAGSTAIIARVSNLSGGDGQYNFDSIEVKKNNVSISSPFTMADDGSLKPAQDLKYGTYEIVLTVKDGNNESSTIQGTITIDLESNTAFKIVQDGAIVNDITSDYVSAQNPKITLSTQGKKGTGAVSYHFSEDSQKDPAKQSDAISLEETTGIITVYRAMTSNDIYKVYASVEEDTTNGYAKQVTQVVTVHIEPSAQSITFDASVSDSMKFVKDKNFAITASLDRSDGSITYTSTTPSICKVADSTKPIATMEAIGSCVIQAENSDENYVHVTKTKEITLFDGMAAKFTQVITPLKQGDPALDPSTHSVIGKITNLAGNQGDVSYSLKVMKGLVDVSSDFEINTDGEVVPKNKIGYGTYDVEVTLVDATGNDGKLVVKGSIIVGLEENSELKITYQGTPVLKIEEAYADVKAGFSVGITGKKGSGKVHFHLSEDSQKDPSEASEAITINDDGTILVHRAMSALDVYKVYASVEESTIQGYEEQISNTVPIHIKTVDMGELSWLVDGVPATELHETYAPNKKLQLDIAGKLAGSSVQYSLIPVDGLTIDDVVKVDEHTGEVEILHANLTSQIGQVQIKAIVSCAGYDDTELSPLIVQIDKAEQLDFRFSQNVYVMPYGTGSFTPEFLNAAPHDDGTTYNHKLSCPDPYDVRVDAATPDTFTYNVTEAEGASITIKARNLGNRDYKAKEATAILKVLGENESLFDVTVSPSPVITYGEDVTILPDNPESDTIHYTYESMDDTVLVQDETQKDVFHSKKVGTVQIKVTKTETGMAESIVYVSVRVKPKIISVELDGTYEIKTGEAVPSFALKDITSNLVNGDVLPNADIRVAIVNTDTAGTYPITVVYPNDAITSNYSFQQIPCDLIITQDVPENNWYKIYKESDPTKSVIDTDAWYNEPLMIESIHNAYTDISLNGLSDWNKIQKLDVEGIYTTPLYFKDPNTNAFTASKEIQVKLDYTKPIIKSMTGSIVDQTGLWKLLHDMTFGTFFKPKTSVIIHVEDPKVQEDMEVSGVKSIQYKVYLADEVSDTLTPLITNGIISSNDIRENKAAIVLHDPGKYYVCASASDFAGNPGDELCSYLHIRGKGDDSDGDGIPDLNIDIDGDGKADLNITRNPKDKVPYTNIDTNGDGIADTNIDLDGDGEPDLNIGIVHEWKPYIEVDIDNDGIIDFKTGADIPWERNIDSDNDRKPDINVDINKDGIPDINIDTDNDFSKPEINIDNVGDGLPHINIDDNEDGKPDRNIVIFTKWEPKDDVKGNIVYDTMYDLKAKETLIHEETEIVVEASPDHAFLPNHALKVEDQTKEKAEQMQSELSNKLSDKQAVEQVYRISIINEFGEEEEVQDVLRVKIPIQSDVHNPIFYLTKKDGTILKMEGSIEDGYFVFETEELGLLSIVADSEEHKQKDPEPDTPKPEVPSGDQLIDKPKTDVQGNFTDKPNINESDSSSIGGAYTGDTTNRFFLGLCLIGSLGCLVYLKRKRSI